MKKIILLVFCVIVASAFSDTLEKPCKTPDNKNGVGKFYMQCPKLYNLEASEANVNTIRQSRLENFADGRIVVCCPTSATFDCISQRDNESGSCIPLAECKQLLAMFKKQPMSPKTREFLINSQCGATNNKPLVCCSEEDKENEIFIEATTSAPTSTTTTTAEPTTTTREPINEDEPTSRLLKKLETNLLPKAPDCGTELKSRIFHGEVANFYEFPWLALLEYRKNGKSIGFRCGGSLINNRYILTAAHCLEKQPPGWELFSVRIGEWDLESEKDCDPDEKDLCMPPVQDIGIAERIVHDGYTKLSANSHHDIALLRLNKKIRFDDFIKPICLPLAKYLWNKDYTGRNFIAAGFGRTENSTTSTKKLYVKLPYVDYEACEDMYSHSRTLNNKQMCAGGELGKDTCQGDSGGPLMSKDLTHDFGPYYIAGIVSYGAKQCELPVPGVYTKVAQYLEWIVDNIYV